MDILESIGGLAIILGVVYLFVEIIKRTDEKERENEELAKHLNLDGFHWDNGKTRSANLKKILSDPEVRKEAEDSIKRNAEFKRKMEDMSRKKDILDRTFSYDYDELIYEIFAPFAKLEDTSMGKRWECHERLEVGFVKNEIMRLRNINSEEADKLIELFDTHRLINLLSPNKQKCYLGDVLVYSWDIISRDDMSLNKWIQQHPGRENRESAELRRKHFDIVRKMPLSEYMDENGPFDIIIEQGRYYMSFARIGKKVFITSSVYQRKFVFGQSEDTNKDISEIKEILTQKDGFVVNDDNGYLTLLRL